jgi:ankyrin repeat protein
MKVELGAATPLHMAVNKGYKKMVEILLNNYADPNIQDSQGFTPLHIAARKGLLDITKLLISKGCCVTTLDGQGKTAAYWANDYKHDDICKLLPDDGKYDYFAYMAKEKTNGNGKIVVIAKEAPRKQKKKTRAKKA